MATCRDCAQVLTTNEIGISLRLLGRDGKQLLCRNCIAQQFQVDPAVIDRKIEQFRRQGCPLFV